MARELSGRIGRSWPLRLGWFKAPPAPPSTPVGPQHGSKARIDFTLAGVLTDVSVILNQVKVSRTRETTSDNGLGDTAAAFLKGKRNDELTFAGFFDASIDLASHIESLTTFDYYPAGRTGEALSGIGKLIADLSVQDTPDGAVAIEGRLVVEGQIA